MTTSTALNLAQVDSSATARIDRRQTILAQLEAALLSDKLTVFDLQEEASGTGTDPYNSGYIRSSAWTKQIR